jgi:hypothetical protein
MRRFTRSHARFDAPTRRDIFEQASFSPLVFKYGVFPSHDIPGNADVGESDAVRFSGTLDEGRVGYDRVGVGALTVNDWAHDDASGSIVATEATEASGHFPQVRSDATPGPRSPPETRTCTAVTESVPAPNRRTPGGAKHRPACP